MSGGSYWDDPAVKEAEAEYEAAAKAAVEAAARNARSKALDESLAEAKRKLEKERKKWLRAHPHQKPPWRGAFDEHADLVPKDPMDRDW